MQFTGIATLMTALTCSAFSAEPFIEKLDLCQAGDGGSKLYHSYAGAVENALYNYLLASQRPQDCHQSYNTGMNGTKNFFPWFAAPNPFLAGPFSPFARALCLCRKVVNNFLKIFCPSPHAEGCSPPLGT